MRKIKVEAAAMKDEYCGSQGWLSNAPPFILVAAIRSKSSIMTWVITQLWLNEQCIFIHIITHFCLYKLWFKKSPKSRTKFQFSWITLINHCRKISQPSCDSFLISYLCETESHFIIFCSYTSFLLKYNEALSHVDCPLKNKLWKIARVTIAIVLAQLKPFIYTLHIFYGVETWVFVELLLRIRVNTDK